MVQRIEIYLVIGPPAKLKIGYSEYFNLFGMVGTTTTKIQNWCPSLGIFLVRYSLVTGSFLKKWTFIFSGLATRAISAITDNSYSLNVTTLMLKH